MKFAKFIRLLIADPKLEIDDDNIKSVTFDEGLLSITGVCKNPLDGTSLSMDIVYTEEEVDQIIENDKNGHYDELFGFEVQFGQQANKTELSYEQQETKE